MDTIEQAREKGQNVIRDKHLHPDDVKCVNPYPDGSAQYEAWLEGLQRGK
jgi:hypothetical protein